ncbi:hypothetical protein STANM309S_06299 [Streptomyces tanashiensis]
MRARQRRPTIWFEILLIAVSYWTYCLIRNAVPEQKAEALRNADWIWRTEESLGLAFEHAVNHAVNSVTWLIVSMNYCYATLHFVDDHRCAGVAVPVASGPLRGVPYGSVRHHRCGPGRLLPVRPARAAAGS